MLKLYLKRWVMFSIIAIFSLIIGARTSVASFHLFFWFLISVAVINLVWVLIAYVGIRLYLVRKAVNKMQEDDVLEVKTLIKNNSFLPVFNIVLEDYLTCADSKERKKLSLIEYLGPKSFVNLRYNCRCPVRGKYRIGPLVVYFFDLFGLFFFKRTYYIYSELHVYPRTFRIKKFPSLVRGVLPWFGIETTRVSGDEDEFFGIREYKQGDPIKRIHWVSTARKNILIVKQFQRQSFFSATILFNLEKDKNFGEGKERIAEYIIKIAASVSKYLLEMGASLGIIVHAGEIVHIPFNKGPEYLEDILKLLAIAQAESRVSLGEIFDEFSRYIPNDSSLIVIMLDTDEEYLESMLLLEKRNISLIPLILVSSTFLYPSDRQKALKEATIRISPRSNLKPLYFCRGDNLEEGFLKY